MSEFQQQATVIVSADTAPFRAQLVAELKRARKEQVEVRVVANTKGFATDLRKRLQRLRLAPVDVRVAPVTTGFRASLVGIVERSSKGVVAKIKMAPDPKGFRAKLATAAKLAAEGVSVPVVASTSARGARGAAETSAAALEAEATSATKATSAVSKKASTTKAAATAEDLYTAAVRKEALANEDLTSSLGLVEGLKAQELRLNEALKASRLAVSAAIAQENTELIANTEALRASIGARQAATAAAIKQAEAVVAAPTVDPARVKAAAAAEKSLVKAEVDRLRSETALISIEQRHAAALASVASAEEARVSATIAGNAALAERAAEEVALTSAAEARLRPLAASVASEREVARVRGELSTAAKIQLKSEQDVGSARSRLNIVTKALAAAEKNLNAVIGIGTIEAEAHARALYADAVAAEAAAAANLELANSAAFAAKQQVQQDIKEEARLRRRATRTSQLTRGLATQGLTAAGARGATLAASGAFLAGTATAVAIGASIKQAADFEKQLAVFNVTANATQEEMVAVGTEARKMGKDITLPGVSAKEAAQSMTELSKAGLSVEDSMSGARGVLQLATAAEIDTARASELVASALNSFGLSGGAAVSVADLLANASIQAQGSIEDMGIALQQASAVGRQVGLSLDDTVSLLTLLAKNGIQGSDAGTSLRTALLRLSSPTEKAEKELKRLGVTLFDTTGALRPEAFAELGQALAQLPRRQQAIFTRDIFGQDAIRAFTILSREGIEGLRQIQKGNSRAGSTAKIASAQMVGLGGAMENMKNQAAAAATTLGKDLIPAATGVANTLAGVFAAANKFFGGDIEAPTQSLKTAVQQLQGVEFQIELDDQGTGEIFAKTLPILEKRIAGLGENLVKRGRLDVFFEAFKGGSEEIRKAMEDDIITPSEKASLSASVLGRAFLSALPKKFFSGLAAGVRSGIEDASRAARVGIVDTAVEVRSGVEDMSREGARSARSVGENIGESLANGLLAQRDKIKAALEGLVIGLQNQMKGLQDELNKQILAGSREGQINVLQDMFKNAASTIAIEEARLKALQKAGKKPGQATARERIRAARESQVSVQQQIKSLREQAKSEAENAAQEIQKSRDEADQKIIDSFEGPRTRISDAISKAAAAGNVDLQIQLQKQLISELERERRVVSASVKGTKTKTQQLLSLGSELVRERITLDELRKERTKNIISMIEQKFEGRIALAESTGNMQMLIKALDREIVKIKEAIEKAKGNKAALEILNDTLAGLEQQRRDAQDRVAERQVTRAQLRLDLGIGSEQEVLAALDKKIAVKRAQYLKAKREHKITGDIYNELLQAQLDRKEFLKKSVDEAKKGTTAFDLLQQFSETFNQSAGNLIGFDQPFAGPTGFTADIAQFLKRQQGKVDLTIPSQRDQQVARDRAFNELIAALQDNTNAIRGTGNRTTGGTTANGTVIPSTVRARRFFEAHQQRAALEAETG